MSVINDSKELVNVIVVPYTPPKCKWVCQIRQQFVYFVPPPLFVVSVQYGMSQIGELPDSPMDSSSKSHDLLTYFT